MRIARARKQKISSAMQRGSIETKVHCVLVLRMDSKHGPGTPQRLSLLDWIKRSACRKWEGKLAGGDEIHVTWSCIMENSGKELYFIALALYEARYMHILAASMVSTMNEQLRGHAEIHGLLLKAIGGETLGRCRDLRDIQTNETFPEPPPQRATRR